MKRKELKKTIAEIEKRLGAYGEDGLPGVCIKVMQEHGTFNTKDYDDYIFVDGRYSDNVVDMIYKRKRESELRVVLVPENRLVLSCRDGMTADEDRDGIAYPVVSGHYVHLYHPGRWEEHIELLSVMGRDEVHKAKLKEDFLKEQARKGAEKVPDNVLSGLKSRYSGFFD